MIKLRALRLARLPNPRYAVSIEYGIDTDQRRFQFERLRREKTVERIAMMEWKQRGTNGVERVDRNGCESLVLNDVVKIGNEIDQRLMVFVGLESNLPGNDGRDENLIFAALDQPAAELTKPFRTFDCPECRVRFEQEFYAAGSSGLSPARMSKPNSCSSSSVSSGFQNSSG